MKIRGKIELTKTKIPFTTKNIVLQSVIEDPEIYKDGRWHSLGTREIVFRKYLEIDRLDNKKVMFDSEWKKQMYGSAFIVCKNDVEVIE